jgi:LuxR family maltose regulon positive regulatory protein
MIATGQDSVDTGIRGGRLAVSHKFSPPSALTNAISRPRLLDDVFEDRDCSAVVIQGPAGYGKSTLMQQVYDLSASRGMLTGWLTLEESDDDISRFNTLLSLLIQETCQQRQASGPYLSLTSGNSAVEHLLDVLMQTSEPIAFFIDEFQSIHGSINLGLINTLIERCPAHVIFYIGSRAVPDLVHGRLLISGRIKLVTADDLCFTTKEIYSFLASVGLEVSEPETEALREQTAGWPAVLQLLHLALKGGRVERSTINAWIRGCQNELADYLADNVMEEQPPSCVEFLKKTSLLPRLSAPLCEVVTGDRNSRQVLQGFVDQGLFIRVIDQEQQWFKYHSVFSSYLQNQFRKDHSAQDEADIRGVAASWFYQAGLFEEAVGQATVARDYELATQVLCEWAPRLICGARLQTVQQFISLLPADTYLSVPTLCWSLSWARLFSSHRQTARESLDGLQRFIASNPGDLDLQASTDLLECTYAYVTDDVSGFTELITRLQIETSHTAEYQNFEMGALGNLHAIYFLRQRSFTLAREKAILAQSLAERGQAAFSGAYAIALTALSLIETGELKLALKKLKEALNSRQLQVQGSFSTAPVSALYGHALYEAGQFVEAESHLRDSMDTISKTLPTDFLILSYLTLARASDFNDSDGTDALEVLDDADKLAFDRQDRRLAAAVRREHIRRALAAGKLKQAIRLQEDTAATGPGGAMGDTRHIMDGCDDDEVCGFRLGIYTGDAEGTHARLKRAMSEAEENDWARRDIRLQALAGVAAKIGGDNEAALDHIRAALEQASVQGYAALFLEEGRECIALVRELTGHLCANQDNRVCQLVSTILPDYSVDDEKFGDKGGGGSRLVEQPTKRELEILTLVANGSSNSEIADQLFVSNNTVKYHLKNLYGKLGVNNRIKLITKARRLDLV